MFKTRLILALVVLQIVLFQVYAVNIHEATNDVQCQYDYRTVAPFLSWFQTKNLCVHIVIENGKNMVSECFQLFENLLVVVKNLKALEERNLYKNYTISSARLQCIHFIVFLESTKSLDLILSGHKRFHPSSYIYFVFHNSSKNVFYEPTKKQRQYLNENVIYAYILEKKFIPNTNILVFSGIRNILTNKFHILSDYNQTKMDTFFARERIINQRLRRINEGRMFNISFYECLPNVIYAKDKGIN